MPETPLVPDGEVPAWYILDSVSDPGGILVRGVSEFAMLELERQVDGFFNKIRPCRLCGSCPTPTSTPVEGGRIHYGLACSCSGFEYAAGGQSPGDFVPPLPDCPVITVMSGTQEQTIATWNRLNQPALRF